MDPARDRGPVGTLLEFHQHPARLAPEALLHQCAVRHGRVAGPGGQHRNKVQTAVFLRHEPSGVAASATERRSQQENLHKAIFRLRLGLAVAVRSRPPADFLPSELWRSRTHPGPATLISGLPGAAPLRVPGKPQISVNPAHRDFPAILAEALDYLAALGWDPARAAVVLGVSLSQLLKLLRAEPRALALLNQHRRAAGRHELK